MNGLKPFADTYINDNVSNINDTKPKIGACFFESFVELNCALTNNSTFGNNDINEKQLAIITTNITCPDIVILDTAFPPPNMTLKY